VERLNAVVNKIMATREMAAALIAEGTRNMLISPQAYAQLIKDDTATWRKSIEPLKLKLE
jgi:tripartite-type tricarboxylate transporter receptor subunit TctC